MKPLETIFIESGSRPMKFMGNNKPPWSIGDNWENYNHWYNEEGINFFYNIVEEGNKITTFIQYGRRAKGWASARFIEQQLYIYEENPTDTGIELTGYIKVPYFKGKETGLSTIGWQTDYTIKVNNQTLYNFTGNSIDRFNKTNNVEVPFNVVIKPEEYSEELLLFLSFIYEEGSGHENNIFHIGTSFYNPNPKTYIPLSIRKEGRWLSLNKNNGYIFKRVGSKWENYSHENINSVLKEGKGKNRIRKNNKWLQLPPNN